MDEAPRSSHLQVKFDTTESSFSHPQNKDNLKVQSEGVWLFIPLPYRQSQLAWMMMHFLQRRSNNPILMFWAREDHAVENQDVCTLGHRLRIRSYPNPSNKIQHWDWSKELVTSFTCKVTPGKCPLQKILDVGLKSSALKCLQMNQNATLEPPSSPPNHGVSENIWAGAKTIGLVWNNQLHISSVLGLQVAQIQV